MRDNENATRHSERDRTQHHSEVSQGATEVSRQARGLSAESRNWAVFAHLSTFSVLVGVPFGNILGPLVIWLIKRREDPYAERHAREALNFNLSLTLYGLTLLIVGLVLLVVLIGLAVLLMALLYFVIFFFVWLILSIVAAIAASRGDHYTYPLSIRLIS